MLMMALMLLGLLTGPMDAPEAARGRIPGPPPRVATVRAALADSLTRYQPTQAPPTARALFISAARNEWQGFQIVLTAGAAGLQGANVTSSRFVGPGGATIPAPTLYREQYVRVTQPSTRSTVAPGWWPDALVPFRIPAELQTGGPVTYPGAPFAVQPGWNQPVYAEVYVPSGTPAGQYYGTLRASAAGLSASVLSVMLTVWDFELPASPTCRSYFGSFDRMLRRYGLTEDSPRGQLLVTRYQRALVQHRLMPARPIGSTPPADQTGAPAMGLSAGVLDSYFIQEHGNSIDIPFHARDAGAQYRDRAAAYIGGYYRYLAASGWGNAAYVYPVDEPHSAADYELVRQCALVAHQADPRLRLLCTVGPVPGDPAWGSLVGYVDIWCPSWPSWDQTSVGQRLAAGEEVWSYTALAVGERPTPSWQLDFPLLNYRVASWQNWLAGCAGLLYWSTVNWTQTPDPWTVPLTFTIRSASGTYAYNGEGMLLYPGDPAGIDGPVTSLRLKAIRDGMQDYDYCALLAQRTGRPTAEAVVRAVARSWNDWTPYPGTLASARDRLAMAILANP